MQKWTESPFGVLDAHFLSPSLLPSHSVSITHTPPPPLLSALLFISIALLSQPWLSNGPGVAPLIFHIPLFLLFGHFPKALWVSGGKLLATDYSYMVISPCFAPLSVSFASLSFFLSVFPFHFCLSLAVFLLSHYVFFLRSFYSTLTVLGQFFLLALLSFTHIYFYIFLYSKISRKYYFIDALYTRNILWSVLQYV